MDPLLSDATEAQRRAITHLEGPLLVLAGPGSGKTRVVTRRIAWLIDRGVPPENLLAITFTNKAAREMRDRVNDLTRSDGAWISTFHSMGARMLRRGADRVGLDARFTIYDDSDQVRVVRAILKEMSVDVKRFRPAAIRAAIGKMKGELITPEEAAKSAPGPFDRITAEVYAGYERRLLESNAADFDDLLVKTLRLLRENPDHLDHYRRRFRFVLVDEYQDTNRVQFELMRILAAREENVHVTGDPDQSIYRFRGADIRNILEFEKVYPETLVIRLEENFRSTRHILAGADSLIRRNEDRKPKTLVATREGGERIRLHEALDEEHEGRIAADVVRAALDRGVPASEIAVFYRIHALSRSLERAFIDRRIPYTIVRGTEFFHRAEVQDLLGYLKVLVNARDNESFLRILNVPSRGIGKTSRDRLLLFARQAEIPIREAIEEADRVPGLRGRSLAAVKGLAGLLGRLSGLTGGPVASLLEETVRLTRYGDHLKTRYPDNHEERWENVDQLVSSAAEFEEQNPGAGLTGYLEEVSLLSDVDRYDGREERVAFMTLHTAKGLEFRVVVLIGLENGLLPHSRSLDSREDMEEERRLLFVGMTRAKDELHLSLARERFRWGEHGVSSPSRFLDEIDPEVFERPEAEDEEEDAPHYVADEWVQPDPAAGLASGMLVRHSHFGVGRVQAVSGHGASARVTVDFVRHGRKRLVATYAKLVPCEEGIR